MELDVVYDFAFTQAPVSMFSARINASYDDADAGLENCDIELYNFGTTNWDGFGSVANAATPVGQWIHGISAASYVGPGNQVRLKFRLGQ